MRLALGSVAAIAALSTLSPIARAADSVGGISYYNRNRNIPESPQNAAVELRVGRYVPNIDGEFGASPGPYELMFGADNRYSVGFEVDWQALRIPYLGTLGPGLGFGYTEITARAFKTPTTERGGEDTSLTIFPLYLVGVFRADVIARETPVPIVPYAKLGVGMALWRISNGGGTASVNGVDGEGLSTGPQFALGGMLLLDAIDRNSAQELDSTTGVNNSYLFVEWYVSHLDGFGSGKQLQVGTNTWVLGLALEM